MKVSQGSSENIQILDVGEGSFAAIWWIHKIWASLVPRAYSLLVKRDSIKINFLIRTCKTRKSSVFSNWSVMEWNHVVFYTVQWWVNIQTKKLRSLPRFIQHGVTCTLISRFLALYHSNISCWWFWNIQSKSKAGIFIRCYQQYTIKAFSNTVTSFAWVVNSYTLKDHVGFWMLQWQVK